MFYIPGSPASAETPYTLRATALHGVYAAEDLRLRLGSGEQVSRDQVSEPLGNKGSKLV